jgi:alkylhydroperoxidase family enzyme
MYPLRHLPTQIFAVRLSEIHINVQPLHRPLSTSPTSRMRVPYAPREPPTEEAKPVYERIAARRNPRPLIPLDLALLHNPAVADGLAISRIAALKKAVHEWDVHAAIALKAGVSKETMELVFSTPFTGRGSERTQVTGLKEDEAAVLAYTDQMTVGVHVEEGVVEKLKQIMNDTQVVELTATIAAYNCVSRFLVALDVGECNGRDMKKVSEL